MHTLKIWRRTGLVIACVDFLFASALSVYGYGSTFARLWEGVASVPLGPDAVGGRWWIQLAGHIFFVGLPTVFTASRAFGAVPGTKEG